MIGIQVLRYPFEQQSQRLQRNALPVRHGRDVLYPNVADNSVARGL